MTWYFDPSGETFDLYNHNGDLAGQDIDFPGSWTGNTPEKVKEIMMDRAVSNANQDRVGSAFQILRDLLQENIEEGTPP